MSGNVEIEREKDYLHVTYTGDFSLTVARNAVDILAESCSKENCCKVLFDCTLMTGELTIMDRYQIGQYGTVVFPRTVKIAMLGREDHRLPDDFFENVVVNRGLTLKEFYDRNEAIKWLKE